ncbi:magnesium transporter [Halomarina salina]|uniref:Magnesium transporter n=1 Tax=Halomarina salina TaxID=1872699 RepID=A0ABD5RNQ7_9EURY|nr:magnesium transporter [Halomarina salina]
MTVGDVAREAYREGLPALSASAFGGLLAGVALSGMRAEFEAVAGLLVLVPALLATRGNVYGSLGARVATALHQGLVEPRLRGTDERLRAAVVAALANGIVASVFSAVVAWVALVALAQSHATLLELTLISFLAALLSGIVLAVVVVVVVFSGFKRGFNPDTLVGPIVTTAGDVFGVLFLWLSVQVVVGVL